MDFYDLFTNPTDPTPPTTPPPSPPRESTPYAAAALRREADIVATTAPGARNDTLNKAWFRMGRHVGAGNIDPGTVHQTLEAAGHACGLTQKEIDLVLRTGPTGGLEAGTSHPRHPPPSDPLPGVTILDDGPDPDEVGAFWTARPILTHLHTFARARRVSPWAVLGVTLARIITATPHQVCLPPIVGGRASLNLFVGLVGASGTGKGAAEAVSADALHLGYLDTHTTGSGEGIAHGYMKRVNGNVEWRNHTHAVLFSVPEIDTLAAQGDRRGTTLMPELRRAWSGEQLGFGYADPTKRLPVPAHQYRMCLIAGIQPARAGCLLNDTDGGTPQRFLWLPATDPDAPDQSPPEPKPLSWGPPPTGPLAVVGGIRVTVCDQAAKTIDQARLDRLRGNGDALDGHTLLAQLKVAAALGILDQRYTVTDDDWLLAETIIRKSLAVRGHVQAALAAKATTTNLGRADAEADRAIHVTDRVTEAMTRRVCSVIVRRLAREAGGWVPAGALRKAVKSTERGVFGEAVERLLEAGQIDVEAQKHASGHGGHGTRYRQAGATR